jgi:RNA recognition motif-containing protein
MGKRVFVGNLPFSATEEELRTLFSQHGEVSSVSIARDRYTERPRGFAFVEMITDEAATAAIAALNQYQLGGRALTVNEARERTEGRRFDGDRRPRSDDRGGGFNRKRW